MNTTEREAVCVRCKQPVVKNAEHYEALERMHWVCFHLEYEHRGDPDEPCLDPSCFWRVYGGERKMTAGDVRIQRRDLLSSDAQALISALDEELARVYPEEGATHFRLDPGEVAEGKGAFLVAFCGDAPVGCGAVRRIDAQTGELKRMYVAREVRGQGVGLALLVALQGEARRLGLSRLVLETGVRQARALSLYQRNGFERIPHFGEYVGSPLSVCMAKDL